jgi:hypothetical protein
VSRTRIFVVSLVLLAVVSAAAGAYGALRRQSALGELPQALEGRGKVVRIGEGPLADLRAAGSTIVPVERAPAVAAALRGHDPEALLAAMRAEGVSALLVGAPPSGAPPRAEALAPDAVVQARLEAYARTSPLRAVHLAPAGALYEPEPTADLEVAHREALARIARAIVGGAPPPPITAFPEPLRRVESVEVMVLLRDAGTPRLWRSARGSSIARALVTASIVARQRWHERESAMGGPLDALLPRLEVEVALLLEDGTLDARDPAFLDRVFTPAHGVAYERRASWRYLLPQATRQEGEGSAARAYQRLFAQNGLPASALENRDCRLYRLAVQPLSTSSAAAGGSRRWMPPLPTLAGEASTPE